MGRRPILHGAQHAAELLLQHVLAIAGNVEGLAHDFRLVVTDCARAQLIAIAHNIVLEGIDG